MIRSGGVARRGGGGFAVVTRERAALYAVVGRVSVGVASQCGGVAKERMASLGVDGWGSVARLSVARCGGVAHLNVS